jgi:nudix-type nucleoside diphosphatase (YffH/AdpP family)
MRYRQIDGQHAEMSREVYHRGHAAAILLHDPVRDTVVLVRQFRPPPLVNGQSPYLIEACAGLLDGDTPAECAQREALEETGIEATNLRLITAAYSNPAALTEVLTMFIGNYEGGGTLAASGGITEEGEDIEVLEMSFDEAFGKVSAGEIIDMKTIILLQALMIERLSEKCS